MKSVEEYVDWIESEMNGISDRKALIIGLNAFANERLEEAAKIAERNMCGLDICGVDTSSKIRALKSSEGKR